MKRTAWLLGACVALAATSAFAAPPPAPAPASPTWLRADKPVAKRALDLQRGPSPLRVGAMLLVVATLGGIAYYARKRQKNVAQAAPNGALRVLGTTRVGAKATAVVIEVSGKRLLLGVTEQAVSTLAWLDDEANAALDDGREASGVTEKAPRGAYPVDDVAAAGPSGFLRLLRNAVGTGAGQRAPSAAAAPVDEVVQATRDEVRISRREPEDALTFEGQVMGLARRRKDTP